MEVAHIAPYSMLHLTKHKKYHMLLPSCLQNPLYRKHFNALADDSGKFVIMDNGMFEDDMMTNERLIDLARTWRVNEVVMPDVRGDMPETLKAVNRFLDTFKLATLPKQPSIMCVVQVRDLAEVETFMYTAADIERLHFGHNGVFTYGIPRRLAEDIGPYTRIKIAKWISIALPSNPIHLLGFARARFMDEVRELAGIARSMDTDAAFVWAYNHAFIDRQGRYERPDDFMGTTLISDRHLEINSYILDMWASVRA